MNYNVLVANDIALNRKIIMSILDRYIDGLIFYEAEDGVDVLEIIDVQSIDIIILDLMMPRKSGYEVLQELKSREDCRNIPVIINSALDDMESIKQTLEMGALDYFTLPLKPQEIAVILPLKVKNALSYYEQSRALLKINTKNNKELAIANTFQNSLMRNNKSFGAVEMYGKYIPCGMVGGDLYDCIAVGESTWFIIADVIGHGIVAAMISTMIRGIFSENIQKYEHPHQILKNMNNIFCKIQEDMDPYLISAFVSVLRDNTLFYANAGHPYPLIVNCKEKNINILQQNGYLLGMKMHSEYETEAIALAEGESVLLYSDGLFNASVKNDLDMWDKVSRHALEYMPMIKENPTDYLDVLVNAFRQDCNEKFEDDVSMMLIKKK